MKRLVIEVDDTLHKKIKMQALSQDKTIKDYIREIIKRDLENEKE